MLCLRYCSSCAGIVRTHTVLSFHQQRHTHTQSKEPFLHCSKSGSRFSVIYNAACLIFTQWLCSLNADFHPHCVLMGLFPLSHANLLLLLFTLPEVFCVFALVFASLCSLANWVNWKYTEIKIQPKKEITWYRWFVFGWLLRDEMTCYQ